MMVSGQTQVFKAEEMEAQLKQVNPSLGHNTPEKRKKGIEEKKAAHKEEPKATPKAKPKGKAKEF